MPADESSEFEAMDAALGLRGVEHVALLIASKNPAIPHVYRRAVTNVTIDERAVCTSPSELAVLTNDCRAGRSALIGVLLQHEGCNLSASDDQPSPSSASGGSRAAMTGCMEELQETARAAPECALAIGTISFAGGHARSGCAEHNGSAMCTAVHVLAAGRARAWARTLFPGADMFVRARMGPTRASAIRQTSWSAIS
jgi:hypothetical protein